MKHICIIADGYPYGDSNHCVFVRELVAELAQTGVKCTVIVPRMRSFGSKSTLPYKWLDRINHEIYVEVYAPQYLACSSKPGLMGITMFNHKRAVWRTIRREHLEPDVMYGHFIYLNGLTAVAVAQKLGIKSYIACGENTSRLLADAKPYSVGLKRHGWRRKLAKTTGFICVSGENLRLLLANGFIHSSMPVLVIPNGVNTDVFKPTDKAKARKALGIGDNDFVVAFVGAFIRRKGPERVDQAVCELAGVKTIFIGRGEFTPQSDCAFCGSVKHDLIPQYLSAADVFVLPTTGEGCCNAIVEAICCGLPVISSADKFNDDVLDEQFSLRVDPLSVVEIRENIQRMMNDRELCERMHHEALKAAERFSLTQRAHRIIDFIEEK